jgi:DNA-binding transcriptional LysR family regulator
MWRAAKARGDFYYCDNSYFDSSRQTYFRVTKNRLQHPGIGESTGERFRALGLPIRSWRDGGAHVVICPQSDEFMSLVVGRDGDWCNDVIEALQSQNPRPRLRVREWNRDKAELAATLTNDLVDAHALITWSSAAAVTAVLSGVPVVVMSDDCAARPMSGHLDHLDDLPRPERANWAGVLADNQWTLAEMRSGMAWKALQ